AAFTPGARQVHTRRVLQARARGDVSRERRARERHLALVSQETLERPSDDPEVDVRGPAAVDAALQRNDLELALRRATLLGMRGAEIALRAVALGRPELARKQAELVLAADPNDVNGRVALHLAHELLGSTPPAPTESRDPLPSSGDLHPLAVMLFGELLDRRVGRLASEPWRQAHPVPPSSDYLVERVRRRQGRPPGAGFLSSCGAGAQPACLTASSWTAASPRPPVASTPRRRRPPRRRRASARPPWSCRPPR